MHKYSFEDRVHHVLYFILVFLKLQTEKNQVPSESFNHWRMTQTQQATQASESPTSFLFCSSSSSFSFARLPMILFLSASYCLWVLSW